VRDSRACTRFFWGNTGPLIQEETNCIRLFSLRRVVHDRLLVVVQVRMPFGFPIRIDPAGFTYESAALRPRSPQRLL
jgi:hypothetical protein